MNAQTSFSDLEKAPPAAPPTLYLNVIFHGLCVFVERKTDIAVFLPNMGDEHVYRAGTWLAETSLKRGSEFVLDGVKSGRALFDRQKYLFIPNLRRSRKQPFVRMTFPRPLEIFQLRPVTLQDKLSGATASKLPSREWATQTVFRYEVGDLGALRLGEHPWVPAFVGDTANLHIYAEPEVGQDLGHSRREFEKGVELFKDVSLTLNTVPLVPPVEKENLPKGVSAVELDDLIPRSRRLALMGRFQKTARSLDLVWDDTEPFGGSPSACGNVSGGC